MKTPSEERWIRVEALFDEALDLDLEARRTLLDRACAEDPALRREVERLLEADAQNPTFFQERAAAFAAPLLADLAEPAEAVDLGRRVGPYRLVKEIGRGGMGRVFLAERADEAFEQQVALKLVHSSLAAPAPRDRFLRERQILARLRHPGIARLLDGGTTDEGQPYLVMEYVEGRPITAYCDAHRRSVTARLQLFGKVCEAVHYAHQNLVVHRDLKPSNILVEEDPGSGPGQAQVKLLDFGIAKLLEDDDEALTRTGLAVMTPEYAAPEQVRREAVTTATDVYALGILLYELLSGHRPYQVRSLAPSEVERVICEVEPPRLSTAVQRTMPFEQGEGAEQGVTPEQVSVARSTQPSALQRRLIGDLDMIVAKALAKEPARRYATASELAQDVKRHLAGLPVLARGNTLGYRLRKFVRRHRWGVAATLAVAVSLLTGLGVALWQAQVARTERDQAQREREKAEQVTDYMASIFNKAHPDNAQGDTLNVYDVLALGVAELDSTLADQPETQAQLMEVMGQVYLDLGTLDQARDLFERSLDLRQALHGPTHVDVASSMNGLAQVWWQEGAYEAADSLNQRTLALQRELLGDEHPAVLETINNLGTVWYMQGRYTEAESLFQELIPVSERVEGPENNTHLRRLNNLANTFFAQGEYEEARGYLQQILDTRRRLLGEMHPDVAFSMDNLAWTLHIMGEQEEAARMASRALALQRRILGEKHPNIPWTLGTLANALAAQERLDTALVLAQEGLQLRREILGDEHPDLVLNYNSLAKFALRQEDIEAAERYAAQEYALARKALGPRHRSTAAGLHHIGQVHHLKGDLDGAVSALQEALEIMQEVLGEEHPQTLTTQKELDNVRRAANGQ